MSSLAEIVESLADALLSYRDKAFAFFGHSMGGLVCFELARFLRRRGEPQPDFLIVSGSIAPHLPPHMAPLHGLGDVELIEGLRRLNGTPAAALDHPELMSMLLPVIRADLAMYETYAYSPEPPLDRPVVAYGGLRDPEVWRDDVEGWREHTSGAFRCRMFEGDHFFPFQDLPFFLQVLSRDVVDLADAAT